MVAHGLTPCEDYMVFWIRGDNALRIHGWYICLHLAEFYGFHVGKYTLNIPYMDPMG